MRRAELEVTEIFASIEGEGLHVGEPMVFLRLAGCNLRCRWCDTPQVFRLGRCMGLEEAFAEIKKWDLHRLSLTGGEPLLQARQVIPLLRQLKEEGYWIQVSTNGTLYNEQLFELCDFISCDIKPPSSGEQSDWNVIKRIAETRDVDTYQFKIVVQKDADFDFYLKCRMRLKDSWVILQPEYAEMPYSTLVEKFLENPHERTRVIPQVHKLLGVR